MKQKLTPRDKMLRKKYGRTEEEVNTVLAGQENVCRVCGSAPVTKSLHLDHDHKVQNWKILSKKAADKKWIAWPAGFGAGGRLDFIKEGRTKPEALAKVREKLKRLSSRGMLCFSCNSGLQKFRDSAWKLRSAANYIDDYQSWLGGAEKKGFTE